MICGLEKYSIFAEVSDQGTLLHNGARRHFLCPFVCLFLQRYGLFKSYVPVCSFVNSSLVGNIEANSPFSIQSFNFSCTMTKEMKNASKVNNSSLASTSAHETGIQSKLTVSPETQALIGCLESLNNH